MPVGRTGHLVGEGEVHETLGRPATPAGSSPAATAAAQSRLANDVEQPSRRCLSHAVELRRLGAGALELEEVRVAGEQPRRRPTSAAASSPRGMRVSTGPKNATPSMWMVGRADLACRPGPCPAWCDLRSASSYSVRVGGVGERLGQPGLGQRLDDQRRGRSRGPRCAAWCRARCRGRAAPPLPCACSAAMQTRTGPQPRSEHLAVVVGQVVAAGVEHRQRHDVEVRSMSRCFSTSRIQREVTQANGHSGSK